MRISLYYSIRKKIKKDMQKQTISISNPSLQIIKNFLKSNLKGNYIYYNNPKNIKIVIPNFLVQDITKFLESENIIFQIKTPNFIVHKFRFIYNMSEFVIVK